MKTTHATYRVMGKHFNLVSVIKPTGEEKLLFVYLESLDGSECLEIYRTSVCSRIDFVLAAIRKEIDNIDFERVM